MATHDALLAVPDELAHLVASQQAVGSRAQLAALGIDWHTVRTAACARRWQIIGRTVVVLHNAQLTPEQRRWVAVLLAGKAVALAAWTALEVAGLVGFESERVHVVVAADCNAPWPDWVRVHNSRRFCGDDVAACTGLPRTSVARAAVDAAAWSRTSRRAAAILAAAVQQRLTTPEAIWDELDRAGRVNHRAVMLACLPELASGAHTVTEAELGTIARASGLPRPRRQVPWREPDGRRRYADAEFTLPDGALLSVEIDGAGHLAADRHADDLHRQNESVIGGRIVLRFASTTIRFERESVIGQLRRIRVAHSSCSTLAPL